ncbi:MAG: MFS transporter [Acidobacteria bacterium]|nr:MFS transporter [Acidobacteriota bacterium]
MKRSAFAVGLVFLIFFVISLVTNILNSIIPNLIEDFHLSLFVASLVTFFFFVAYGVMSIPAGVLLERFHERPVLIASFVLAFVGSIAFATMPRFGVMLPSLFLIGAAFAMLQVSINPLLRVAGGEEHFAFNSAAAQLVFGLASFLSPWLYAYLVQGLQADQPSNALLSALSRVVPSSLPWVSLYWVFAVVTLVMILVVALARLPEVVLKEDERAGAMATYRELLRKPIVWLFFFGIFVYVGTEQGVANWISQFLKTYHGFDPLVEGKSAVSYFWGLMTAGCFLGLLFLKLFDSRRVLVGFTTAAMLALTLALFGPARVSLWAFPLIGFCASVMWPIIFSLALNSMDRHHGAFSGILVTGIVGGALLPPVVGKLGDLFGLRFGMTILYLTLGYILSIGIWARPLITNATIRAKRSEAGPA